MTAGGVAALLFIVVCAAAEAAVPAPTLVAIPGGSFRMGYSKLPIPASLGRSEFPNGDADERPLGGHPVNVSKACGCV